MTMGWDISVGLVWTGFCGSGALGAAFGAAGGGGGGGGAAA